MFVLNPQYIYINSRERESGSDSNFVYNIKLAPDVEADSIVVLNALIPKSYYLIQDTTPFDNVFELVENGVSVTITIPIGSYSLTTFKNTIASLLTSHSPNSLTYLITYPSSTQPDTGKFTYSSSNPAIQSTFVFNDHMYEPMGFLRSSTNPFTAGVLTSSCVLKLQAEDRILIRSNLTSNSTDDDILISINSSTSVNYSSIAWTNPSPEWYVHKLSTKNSSSCYFQITDEDGELLNLNGLNCNFSILIFKANDIYQKINDFMKLSLLKNK